MNILHILSIIIEGAVMIMGLMLVFLRKKSYGWGIALTFGIYVVYDTMKFLSISISGNVLYLIFFIATISAFWSVIKIFKEAKLK
jgi:hypothetical protein